ncbi:MAG: hypothetical protein ABNO82_00705 [Candidatus Shikimatogenerans sp. Tder]|uniref:Uncharacterized protein n=1 Tax=Candidatus Shikimatogenerans sp. Tder TaxID=3158566 RepID=A0AAU7QR74_9FLAO
MFLKIKNVKEYLLKNKKKYGIYIIYNKKTIAKLYILYDIINFPLKFKKYIIIYSYIIISNLFLKKINKFKIKKKYFIIKKDFSIKITNLKNIYKICKIFYNLNKKKYIYNINLYNIYKNKNYISCLFRFYIYIYNNMYYNKNINIYKKIYINIYKNTLLYKYIYNE